MFKTHKATIELAFVIIVISLVISAVFMISPDIIAQVGAAQ